jgi:hypothetical protein
VRTTGATASVWRGYFDGRPSVTARLESWPGRRLPMRLRVRLSRAALLAIYRASTRAKSARWGGIDPGHGESWPESRTRLRDLAGWLRGVR